MYCNFNQKFYLTGRMGENIANVMRHCGDNMIANQFRDDMLMQSFNQQREHEQLVKEIADEVLSRISITLNNGDALNQIKGLKQAIESLVE